MRFMGGLGQGRMVLSCTLVWEERSFARSVSHVGRVIGLRLVPTFFPGAYAPKSSRLQIMGIPLSYFPTICWIRWR